MNPMVTRCPKCSTSFRITATQLETAKGAVRCGSCLHVFKALDHLVSGGATQSTQTPKATETKPRLPEPKSSISTAATTATTRSTQATDKPLAKVTPLRASTSEPVKSATTHPQTSSTAKTSATKPASASPAAAATVIRNTQPAKTTTTPKAAQPSAKATSLIDPLTHGATKDSAKAGTKKIIIDKSKVLEDEEDLLISDDMDKKSEKGSAYEFDGFIDIDLHPKQNVSLFEREIRYQAPAEDKESADESWAENLLEEEEALDKTPRNLREKINSSTSTPVVTAAMLARRQQEEAAAAAAQETKHSSVSAHESYATHAEEIDENAYPPLFSLVTDQQKSEKSEDDLFSEAFKKAASNNSENTKNAEASPNDFAALFDEGSSTAESDTMSSGAKRNGKSTYKIRMADTSRSALLMNIIPAPVELTARRVRNWYHQKLWPSLAIFLTLTLVFQIAYFNFNYFSRVEPYRSVYAVICPVFGCKLPTLVDSKQIQTFHLVVRQHPDIQNALIVDATILNNADFEQPFPDIILSFTTINNTPVASRRFTPKDYLAGELAGSELMQSKVQVHLSLELTDPGPEAVNYTINIP